VVGETTLPAVARIVTSSSGAAKICIGAVLFVERLIEVI